MGIPSKTFKKLIKNLRSYTRQHRITMAAGMGDVVQCCAPLTLVENCHKDPINKTLLFSMVKMNCTFAACDQSGFMHPECFTELENQLIKRVKAMGFSNSAKSEKFKSKLNFDRDHVKDFLWKDNQKGGFYGMIYKEMTCNCGKGLLTKDMSWPPPNYRRSKKKIVNNSGDSGPKLPTLQGKPGAGGQAIRYVPSVVADFPELESEAESTSTIPGAKFIDQKTAVKRGEVVFWDGWNGHIQNLNNTEERKCLFSGDQVQGTVGDIDTGCEVEYESVRRARSITATSVRLVRSAVYSEGVVTHWSPAHLAGTINTGRQEITVLRRDFVAGGFVGNIVGRFVKFRLDPATNLATYVTTIERAGSADQQDADLDNVDFSALEVVACPVLEHATNYVLDMRELVEDMSEQELDSQLACVEPYLPRLAAHPVGHKLVLALAAHADPAQLQQLVSRLGAQLLALTRTASGAVTVLELLGLVPPELQPALMDTYTRGAGAEVAAAHMMGDHSSLVFQVTHHSIVIDTLFVHILQTCLPLMSAATLRSWVTCLVSGLSTARLTALAAHGSMLALVEAVSKLDTQTLFLLTTDLERRHLLVEESLFELVESLIQCGGKVHSFMIVVI